MYGSLSLSEFSYSFEIGATIVWRFWSPILMKGAYIPEICRKKTNKIRALPRKENYKCA
jgi:hypothetical protein